jgi:hypothetical protein
MENVSMLTIAIAPPALYNFNIQPAMARPISSGESSWR